MRLADNLTVTRTEPRLQPWILPFQIWDLNHHPSDCPSVSLLGVSDLPDLDLCVCTHFQIWIVLFLIFESSFCIRDNNLVTVMYILQMYYKCLFLVLNFKFVYSGCRYNFHVPPTEGRRSHGGPGDPRLSFLTLWRESGSISALWNVLIPQEITERIFSADNQCKYLLKYLCYMCHSSLLGWDHVCCFHILPKRTLKSTLKALSTQVTETLLIHSGNLRYLDSKKWISTRLPIWKEYISQLTLLE